MGAVSSLLDAVGKDPAASGVETPGLIESFERKIAIARVQAALLWITLAALTAAVFLGLSPLIGATGASVVIALIAAAILAVTQWKDSK